MASASVCCGSRSVLRCLRSVSLCAASYPVSPHQSSAFREIRSVRSASGLRGHTAFPKNLPSDRDQESSWGRLPFFRPAPYPVLEGMTAPVGGREGGAVTTASPPLTPCGHLCCPHPWPSGSLLQTEKGDRGVVLSPRPPSAQPSLWFPFLELGESTQLEVAVRYDQPAHPEFFPNPNFRFHQLKGQELHVCPLVPSDLNGGGT